MEPAKTLPPTAIKKELERRFSRYFHLAMDAANELETMDLRAAEEPAAYGATVSPTGPAVESASDGQLSSGGAGDSQMFGEKEVAKQGAVGQAKILAARERNRPRRRGGAA